MPRQALNEIGIVQNTALGAALIWRFGLGFQNESGNVPPTLPLSFLVLPICLHSPTLDQVRSTQKTSGLSLFARKVGESREDLLAIHIRAVALRHLTLESIGVGIRSKLLTVNYQSAQLRSNVMKPPKPPERIKRHLLGAEKLGIWCARLSLQQAASLLKIDF